MKTECAHCTDVRRIVARGLCYTCYYNKPRSVRLRYPTAYSRGYQTWTARELANVAYLRERRLRLNEIAKHLGRTHNSIKWAYKLLAARRRKHGSDLSG